MKWKRKYFEVIFVFPSFQHFVVQCDRDSVIIHNNNATEFQYIIYRLPHFRLIEANSTETLRFVWDTHINYDETPSHKTATPTATETILIKLKFNRNVVEPYVHMRICWRMYVAVIKIK